MDIDAALLNMKSENEILLQKLTQLNQIQDDNCQNRICKCENGFIWDPITKRCNRNCVAPLVWSNTLKECACSETVSWDGVMCECDPGEQWSDAQATGSYCYISRDQIVKN